MNKIIFPHAFNFGVPVATLVDVHSRGIDTSWIQKRAAVLTREISDIRPENGKTFMHLIAMGAHHRYGCNRNGDAFPKSAATYEVEAPHKPEAKIVKIAGGLIETHPTFVKHGNVYKLHKNKDPKKRCGNIKASAYNHDMDRVELIIGLDNDKWSDELNKMASGDDIPFSMATKVPGDYCGYCGHYSKSRAEYCDHLKNQMTQITKSGNQICAINPPGIFFDISGVIRPADRIAWSLQKVASGEIVSSAQLAEEFGVTAPMSLLAANAPRLVMDKVAILRKLSDIEKEIIGNGTGVSRLRIACAPDDSLDDDTIKTLRGEDPEAVFAGLRNAKICLPMRDFFKVLMGPKYDTVSGMMDMAKSMMPGMYNRMEDNNNVEDMCSDTTYDGSDQMLPLPIREIIRNMTGGMSLGEEPVKRRIIIMKISGSEMPRMLRENDSIFKLSSEQKQAERLAKEYTKYQLSFCSSNSIKGDEVAQKMVVLQNYI